VEAQVQKDQKDQKAQAEKSSNSSSGNQSEWIEIYSEKHGKSFWKNIITGEKTWKKKNPFGSVSSGSTEIIKSPPETKSNEIKKELL
jgi:hypothetical protein